MGITDEILADIESEQAQLTPSAPPPAPQPPTRTTESITNEIVSDIESETAARQKMQRQAEGESFLQSAQRPVAPADGLVTGAQQLLRAPGAAVELAGDPDAQDVAAETVGSIVGGVGGGIAGGIAGGPPGAFVAAPLGAAAGGIGASNFMVRLRGKDETPEETEERRIRAGLAGGLGEFGGQSSR